MEVGGSCQDPQEFLANLSVPPFFNSHLEEEPWLVLLPTVAAYCNVHGLVAVSAT